MLLLEENFEEFRRSCLFRKYSPGKHTNEEVIYEGKKMGVLGQDYGCIRCDHPNTKTGWCKEGADVKDCPRVIAY